MIIATKRKCLNQLKSGADFLASTQEADLLLLGFILKTYLQARVQISNDLIKCKHKLSKVQKKP